MKKRLAIIGAGSSGLICLKNAVDKLPEWDLICLEKSNNVRGCWGNPYSGFVSTSTKYTTQFACFPRYDASLHPDGSASRAEFFRDGEYGDYLDSFADAFELRKWIRLQCQVLKLCREKSGSRWQLTWQERTIRPEHVTTETFDAVVLATGLAAQSKPIACPIPTLSASEDQKEGQPQSVRSQRMVVFGGGESAVDAARRLAEPSLKNEVFLSLRSGIRVSPRYHPIRGVPSDFLRNRLMLSIHPDLRNWMGEKFVAARMRYQSLFEKIFPPVAKTQRGKEESFAAARRDWAMRLTSAAKDNLFDMFHNKSDEFLDCVASGQITLVGEPADESFKNYLPFGASSASNASPIHVDPDWIVPAIGFRSGIHELTDGEISTKDFHLGCCHVTHPDLFLVGFARPIIGNVPTISEMQARYITGLLSNQYSRPNDIVRQHRQDQSHRKQRFGCLDLNAVYPVEMFPYCDELAKRMNVYPSIGAVGNLKRWWRIQLAPATTLHYASDRGIDHMSDRGINHTPDQKSLDARVDNAPIYLPLVFTVLLLLLKPIDGLYRLANNIGSRWR